MGEKKRERKAVKIKLGDLEAKKGEVKGGGGGRELSVEELQKLLEAGVKEPKKSR